MSNLEDLNLVVSVAIAPGLYTRDELQKAINKADWAMHNFRILKGLSEEEMAALIEEYLTAQPTRYTISEDLTINEEWK